MKVGIEFESKRLVSDFLVAIRFIRIPDDTLFNSLYLIANF